MRYLSKLFWAGLVVAAVTVAAACGGGEQASNELVDSQLLVTNPSAALGASAERFEDHVQSVEAQFFFEMDFGSGAVGADGNFAYRAPDSLHMTMEMSGGDDEMFNLDQLGPIEMLVLDDDIYMNTGITGWVTMSFEELGADAESLREMLDVHAPLDYRALIEDIGAEVENLGSAEVDGNTYTRLRITTDMVNVMDTMMESLGEDSLEGGLFDLSGPVTMEILMNPATLLPYKFEANAEFDFGGQSAKFKMAFKFFDYNGPVDIPAPPEDAVRFDQAFDEPFGGLGFSE